MSNKSHERSDQTPSMSERQIGQQKRLQLVAELLGLMGIRTRRERSTRTLIVRAEEPYKHLGSIKISAANADSGHLEYRLFTVDKTPFLETEGQTGNDVAAIIMLSHRRREGADFNFQSDCSSGTEGLEFRLPPSRYNQAKNLQGQRIIGIVLYPQQPLDQTVEDVEGVRGVGGTIVFLSG